MTSVGFTLHLGLSKQVLGAGRGTFLAVLAALFSLFVVNILFFLY